ncbi:hypothetical protein RJ640_030909 [Escallonia rubra]|uniref:LITAF domain-containing protein n=1 Tax=Escallonia rubra TaxID=112253 RepID=A0AA88UWE3_9ASTE|nr:hypothetical protein RJ640_030909 [Escallonia rubra]
MTSEKPSKHDEPAIGIPYAASYQAPPVHQQFDHHQQYYVVQNPSKPSLAAFVGCMMPMMLGICFLCPSMDCLWHKYHYCPSCHEKLAAFEKSDPCAVMDPPRWIEESFALPA